MKGYVDFPDFNTTLAFGVILVYDKASEKVTWS